MAQYKVPQDVEADDKLLGPFTFRQFIYLMVTGGCIALAFALFQIFPLLAIIPAPVAVFFAVLALPLKKDQPMETYLAAIVSFHLKPKKRVWTSGQRESTIMITAPKKVEQPRTRDITGEEASHRLSFLAQVVDSEGRSVYDNTPMRDDFMADSSNVTDIFESNSSANFENRLGREQDNRRAELVNQMRAAINRTENLTQPQPAMAQPAPIQPSPAATNPLDSPVVIQPELHNLANNKDYSVQTIAKEANRIVKPKKKNEVYVSLR